jgi:hypothetical protein
MKHLVLWLAGAVVVGAWALFLFGYISVWLALIGTFSGAFLAAWNLDRTGRGAAALRRIDQHRPEFFGRSSAGGWEVPTAYIDHPDGGGAPPGVAQYDEEGLKRDLETGDVDSGRSRGHDPAP